MTKYPKKLIRLIVSTYNDKLFNGALPIEWLTVKQKKKHSDFAGVYCGNDKIIVYLNHNSNINDLIDTIVHEMIHWYQDLNDCPWNHGGRFFNYYADKYLAITNKCLR